MRSRRTCSTGTSRLPCPTRSGSPTSPLASVSQSKGATRLAPTNVGWLYLAAVKDLATIEIVGPLSATASDRLPGNGSMSDWLKSTLSRWRSETGAGHPMSWGPDPSFRSRRGICLRRLPQTPGSPRHHSLDEPEGKLPRQCAHGSRCATSSGRSRRSSGIAPGSRPGPKRGERSSTHRARRFATISRSSTTAGAATRASATERQHRQGWTWSWLGPHRSIALWSGIREQGLEL